MENILYVAKREGLYIRANRSTTTDIVKAKFYKTYKALFKSPLYLRKVNPAYVEYYNKNKELYQKGVESYDKRIEILGPWPTNYYLNELKDDIKIVKVLVIEVE